MNRLTHAAALTLAVASSPASPQSSEQRFNVRGFNAVELTASDSIQIVQGSTVSVVATGDPRAIAALAIDVRGETLRVGRRPGTWRDKGARITVTMPSLRAALLSGSGEIRAGAIERRDFAASISGSGGIVLTDLRVGTARFDLSGSGSIVASGHASTVAIDMSGSGSINTRRLATSAVTVDLGGSGTVTATASRTATIGAGGSGMIRVSGGARCDVRKGGSAIVRCG